MSMDSHQTKKNSYSYCKSLLRPRSKVLLRMPQEGQIGRKNSIARPRLPLIRKTLKRAPHATNLSHNFYHTCMLRDLPTSTKVFLKFIIIHQNDLTLLPLYLKTIIKHQVDHSIQFFFYDSFYYTQLGCSSFQDQICNQRKYHAVLKDSQHNISEA